MTASDHLSFDFALSALPRVASSMTLERHARPRLKSPPDLHRENAVVARPSTSMMSFSA
jgi:hypothetical protein